MQQAFALISQRCPCMARNDPGQLHHPGLWSCSSYWTHQASSIVKHMDSPFKHGKLSQRNIQCVVWMLDSMLQAGTTHPPPLPLFPPALFLEAVQVMGGLVHANSDVHASYMPCTCQWLASQFQLPWAWSIQFAHFMAMERHLCRQPAGS